MFQKILVLSLLLTGVYLKQELPQANGACTNDSDVDAMNRWDHDEILIPCGKSCFANLEEQDCFENCVQKGLNLTDGCAKCYQDNMICLRDTCQCTHIFDMNCLDCVQKKCYNAFVQCSGQEFIN